MKLLDLLGGISPALFQEALFWAAVGIVFVLLLGTGLRDPKSPNSPEKWSLKYLLNDNSRRIAASIIAVLVTLRFMTELTGWQLSAFKGFLVGTAWDGIALFLKQKTSWLDKPTSNT